MARRAMMAGLALAVVSALAGSAALAGGSGGRLIAALSGDWNGDGAADAITLVQGAEVQGAEDAAELVVYLGGVMGLHRVLTVPGAVYAGSLAGQVPGLVARSTTGFTITEEQTGVGREPWQARINVAWRAGRFVVAGYSYAFHDRLDPGHFGDCDVNLRTGDWRTRLSSGDAQPDGSIVLGAAVVRDRSGRDAPSDLPLAGLRADFMPERCQALIR